MEEAKSEQEFDGSEKTAAEIKEMQTKLYDNLIAATRDLYLSKREDICQRQLQEQARLAEEKAKIEG